MKEKLKLIRKEQGITLIALVVTIIILLILAGVAINMALGDNGLFKRSREAVNTWKSAEENETGTLDYLDREWNNLINGGNSAGGKTLVSMYKKAIADNCTDGKACNHPGEHVHVGDYVLNYNATLKGATTPVVLSKEETGYDGTQTYSVDTATTWRVLGLSQDGNQLIITTGSPLKKNMKAEGEEGASWEKDPYLYLKGAEGWYNTNDELTKNNPNLSLRTDNILDKISKLYESNYSTSVASIRIEDINNLLGLKFDEADKTKLYKEGDSSKTSVIADHTIGTKYVYTDTDIPPENYLKETYPENEKYQALPSRAAGYEVEGNWYYYRYKDENVVNQNSKLYNVLFNDVIEDSKSYWLASSGVGAGDSGCDFGPGTVDGGSVGSGRGLAYSGGVRLDDSFAVRPVVYLESNVTEKALQISPNGTEEEWGLGER